MLCRGDRVVVAFDIACGGCYFCKHGYQSSCDTTNPSKVSKQSKLLTGLQQSAASCCMTVSCIP